jgi:hypothetical protein
MSQVVKVALASSVHDLLAMNSPVLACDCVIVHSQPPAMDDML